MTQTFLSTLTQLILSIGWSLLHSLWQGALIWLVLTIILRAFPAMSARLKHGCSLIALLLLGCWIANTASTQWEQLQKTVVLITSGSGSGGYSVAVPPPQTGIAQVPESAWVLISSCMPWLMLAYGLGLLMMTVRFGRSLTELHGLRNRLSAVPDEQMLQLLDKLRLQMGIAQQVALRLSTRVAVPVVVGVLRPLILLPVSMLETMKPGELEAILLHELAHISRADFLINLLLSVFETLLFFNPFVWQIAAVIRREREHCCDDLVVAYTGQPLTYARILANLAAQQPAHSIALAATGRPPLLLNRIKRILEMKNHPLRSGQLIAACSVASVLLAASIICFTPSFAQQSKKNDPQKTTGESNPDEGKRVERIVIIDSNGKRQEFESFDDMPATQQAKLQAELDKSLNNAELSQKHLETIKKQIVTVQHMNFDSISGEAIRSADAAMKNIDWDAISNQMDSAMNQVKTVNWQAMRREVMAGLSEAKRRMADTQWRAQMRRETARAGREIALATRTIKLETQRNAERSSREMERAERRMEEARLEMMQAKAELKRLRRDYSSSAKGNENVAPPAPPAPPAVPSTKGIPAPPAPPATNGIPAPPAPAPKAPKAPKAPVAPSGTVPAAPTPPPAINESLNR